MSRHPPGIFFAGLRIPFPLYAAPIQTAANDYAGAGFCCRCQAKRLHCFRVDTLMFSCPRCDTPIGIDTRRRDNTPCIQCGEVLTLDAVGVYPTSELLVCYDCLRAGKGAFTANTTFGMVTWEQAVQGVTHGVPGLDLWIPPGYEIVKLTEEPVMVGAPVEKWYGVRLPSEWLWELTRTPNYSTWQGELWQFCCQHPMVYIGEWTREDYNSNAPDSDGRRYFYKLTGADSEWLWDSITPDAVVTYAFHCPVCGNYAAHYDYT